MNTPLVSIIIPVRAINDFLIHENLPSHQLMNFRKFEVIVLPDKKGPNDTQLKEKYPWLRIVPTGKVTRPAEKRDIGASKSQGQLLAFIDDDAYPTKTWLAKATTIFEKKGVAAVCGPGILPVRTGFWEKVFDEVLKTWFGSGGYSYRFIPQSGRYVDDYPSMNFLIKREVFFKLGGFNSDFWPGEDSKLCEDLVYTLGEKIIYDPKVVIFHHRRDNLPGYLKQHGQYGFHRGAFFAHGDRNSRRLSYLVPTLFFLYLSAVLLLLLALPSKLHSLYSAPYSIFIPLIIYIVGLLTISISAFKNTKSLKIAVSSAIVIFLMHLVYGIKFIHGFIVGLIRKDNIYS